MPRSRKAFTERKIIPLTESMAVWLYCQAVRRELRGEQRNMAAVVRDAIADKMVADPIPPEEMEKWTTQYHEDRKLEPVA